MIIHDFRCPTCNADYEAIFNSAKDLTDSIDCNCGSKAIRIWKAFGAKGRNGVGEKGNYPRYEIQAGRVFQTSKEEKAYLKMKGLEKQGPDEYRRSLSASVRSHELPSMRPEMEEAWHETVEEGQVVPHKIVDSKGFRWIDSTKEK